jgi:predicted TIM-barrel fold metal-dependent hydrolase
MTDLWPDGVIDPHIHLWDPLTTRRAVTPLARVFRPLPRVPRAVRWLAPKADREFIGNPHHVLKPYLPSDYRADAGEVPVATVVHIEADWPRDERRDSVDETRWITGLPFGQEGAPVLGALVVHVDPRFDDAGAILDEHLDVNPLVRGVRCVAPHHPDPGVREFADQPHLLNDPAFLKGFAAIAERGLSFDVWCFAHQLPDALTLATEYPETTFVLDHYATPVGLLGPRGKSSGRTDQDRAALLAAWHEDVAAFGALPNVVAKYSGLGMPLLGSNRSKPLAADAASEMTDQVAPLIRHVHDVFGADRTMWASNFPIDKAELTLPATLRLVTDVLGSDADLTKLVRDVAQRVYRIRDEGDPT